MPFNLVDVAILFVAGTIGIAFLFGLWMYLNPPSIDRMRRELGR